MKSREQQLTEVFQESGEKFILIYSDNSKAWEVGKKLTEQEAEAHKKAGTPLINIDRGQKQAVLLKLSDFKVQYFIADQ